MAVSNAIPAIPPLQNLTYTIKHPPTTVGGPAVYEDVQGVGMRIAEGGVLVLEDVNGFLRAWVPCSEWVAAKRKI